MLWSLETKVGAKVGTKKIALNCDYDARVPRLVRQRDVPSRNSEDVVTNSRGRKMFNLMTKHDLLLTNGKICGDMKGRYTCFQWNGASAIDYLIIQSDLFTRINYFKFGKFNWASGHAHITAAIAVDIAKYREVPSECKKSL